MPAPQKPTACLALADGTIFYGHGFGATGETVAELVFNTAMTGYQEIMTDPSYAGQVVTFTFPHIGNTGITPEDDETGTPARRDGGEMGPDRTVELARGRRV
jgi:carbamoyl-phosphate synthase small subunit